MSHCKSRFRFNNYVSNELSRFINEKMKIVLKKMRPKTLLVFTQTTNLLKGKQTLKTLTLKHQKKFS